MLKVVNDVSGMVTKSRRGGGGGRSAEWLNELRGLAEGAYGVIPFTPGATNRKGEPVDFETFVNVRRSSLYKTRAGDKIAPTLPYKPSITTGKDGETPVLIVNRPVGSNYVTNPDGSYKVDAEGNLITVGSLPADPAPAGN